MNIEWVFSQFFESKIEIGTLVCYISFVWLGQNKI